MSKFLEAHLVEDYLINKLVESGWKFMPSDELERGYDEPLLIPNLLRAIERINKDSGIGDEEKNRVLNELKLAGTGVEWAKRILNFYKFGVPVKFEKERVVKYMQLFDYRDIENNEFIVTRQAHYYGSDRIRTDIMLYINGIPLVNIEDKSPVSLSENWYTAYKQIKRYEKTVPELYKYVQIGMAVESIARYFAIVPWQDDVSAHEWREEGLDSVNSTLKMLSREKLLDVLRHFLFCREEHGSTTKVVPRYMQYRAANKMVDRVLANLDGKETKDKGLIWHWQGSGKTLTMIFAANKLYYMKELENPTVFFIVDRVELEEQLYAEFNALDTVSPEIIGSIPELKKVIEYDDYRGKRGVFITLIHKFRPDDLKELYRELDEVSKKKDTIKTRRNVIAFIDEGHRIQYGLLATQMKAFLEKAFFFALTGTPIAKKGKDTYIEFSYPPQEPYLDRYFITDSIKDGFTVKIVYQPRLEKKVHLKKELLEAFLEGEMEELPEDARDIVEEKVKGKLNAITAFLENPERIKVIANDIAEHFKENVEGKFKAMVVAPSRKACVSYKKELDKHLPGEYSEVVMTYLANEKEKALEDYREEIRARFSGKDIKEINKDIVVNFKREPFPKILIVTDMLLTGFDAPVLQTLYLDKPLKEHRLLQAIARTNRPYKDVKDAGMIIDYLGILKEFKRAFEMYSEEDIKGALLNYETLSDEFSTILKELMKIFEGVPQDYERETLLKAFEIVTSSAEKEKEFTRKYKKLRKIFELLGPREVKLEYFEEYKWIVAVHTYYTKLVLQKPGYDDYVQKYYEKTVKFIHKSTDIDKVEKDLPLIAFDRKYLEKLEKKVKGKREKAANILFALNRLVLVDRGKNPIYESLVDKVERLLDLWKEKTKDYERIYKEGAAILEKIAGLTDRKETLGFSDLEYSVLLALEDKLGKADELPEQVKALSGELQKHMFAGWLSQASVKKDIERELRKFVRGIKGKYNISFDEMNELHERLVESVKNYGATDRV